MLGERAGRSGGRVGQAGWVGQAGRAGGAGGSGGSGRVGPAGQQVRWVRWAGRAGRVRRPDGSDTCELSCNIGFMICHGLCLAMSEVLRFERPPTIVTQEHKESHT